MMESGYRRYSCDTKENVLQVANLKGTYLIQIYYLDLNLNKEYTKVHTIKYNIRSGGFMSRTP